MKKLSKLAALLLALAMIFSFAAMVTPFVQSFPAQTGPFARGKRKNPQRKTRPLALSRGGLLSLHCRRQGDLCLMGFICAAKRLFHKAG